MTLIAKVLLEILSRCCVGRANAVRRFVLLEAIRQMNDMEDVTDSEMRAAKEDLIEAGVPVGSDLTGYWLIQTEDEAQRAAAFLDERAKDMLHKAALLRRAGERIAERNRGQQQMVFT